MSGVKAAIERMSAVAANGLPKPPTTQLHVQLQLPKLGSQVGEAKPRSDLLPFLRESARVGVDALRRFELSRVLKTAWCDAEFDSLGIDALKRAAMEQRKRGDAATVNGYLVYFPADRPIINEVSRFAKAAAERHDWVWKHRSIQWSLFEPNKGPSKIAHEFVRRQGSDAIGLLHEVGFASSLPTTKYGRAIFTESCIQTSKMRGRSAENAQRNVLALFTGDALAGQLDVLAQALLEPWIDSKPEAEHRKKISDFLVKQIGDPRLKPIRWEHIIKSLARTNGDARAHEIVSVLKRWLTEVAMREFFRAIALTTDRPDQWKDRQLFWLAYLDAGVVTDAWPALGDRAKDSIDRIMRTSTERSEYGVIHGGTKASSSIIFQIGDLRISEWSDNGSCRFWNGSDKDAPRLYDEYYHHRELRVTHGGPGFQYEAHQPSKGWEPKFARVIYQRTGIQHPRWGTGR